MKMLASVIPSVLTGCSNAWPYSETLISLFGTLWLWIP